MSIDFYLKKLQNREYKGTFSKNFPCQAVRLVFHDLAIDLASRCHISTKDRSSLSLCPLAKSIKHHSRTVPEVAPMGPLPNSPGVSVFCALHNSPVNLVLQEQTLQRSVLIFILFRRRIIPVLEYTHPVVFPERWRGGCKRVSV